MTRPFIHPSSLSLIDASARIGDGSHIWVNVQILSGARIGRECTLGKDVFVDRDVIIGDRCKIQNGVSVYRGVTLEDGVFLGPHSTTTNDLDPAAITPDGKLKGEEDWTLGRTIFRSGARIGARAVVVCGNPERIVGRWALVAAGAVVTRDVPDFALVAGHPARLVRLVCPAGLRHEVDERGRCAVCRMSVQDVIRARD